MFRNYLKVMWRNLLKNRGFAAINILGLSTGMAISVLLILYIDNEFGYDDFHGDRQIVRLAMERKYPGRSANVGGIPNSLGAAVKAEFPDVQEVTRVLPFRNTGVTVEARERKFTEKQVLPVDSTFFSVFSAEWLEGDGKTALDKPNTAVINESTARRYFGSPENAMGKILTVGDSDKWLVTGVCRDWPSKSHLRFDILGATAGIPWWNDANYIYFGPYTYMRLNSNTSAAALDPKLSVIVDKYVAGKVEQVFGEPYDKFVAGGNGYRYFLQPIKDIHLHSQLQDEIGPVGSIRSVQLFIAIAAFILFLACINFINLSTALSVQRAREVGVRKTFGSLKRTLIGQFLFESVMMSVACLIVALGWVFIFLPGFGRLAGSDMNMSFIFNPSHFIVIVLGAVVVGAIAGGYPALVLSSFDPVQVLKGKFRTNSRGIALRNGLVIFQFAVSVVLIFCTIVVNRQMQFVLGENLGFRSDHVVQIEDVWQLQRQMPGQGFKDARKAFFNEMSKIEGVQGITGCSPLPGTDETGGGATWVALENNNSRTQKITHVDVNYAKVLGLQLKEARFFSDDHTTDSFGVVLNETAVQDFGLTHPIGARLVSKEQNYNDGNTQQIFTVIGVVKDYHFQSLYKKIAPLTMVNGNKFGYGLAAVSIQGNTVNQVMPQMESVWRQFDSRHDFRFNFLDRSLAVQYKAQQTDQQLFNIFSLLAIFIACVGLLGLATFATVQRAREISIRKVLGAMPGNIMTILSVDFLRLVGIASLIAFPVGWWAMTAWLENFAYRVTISWWMLLIAGIIAVAIALITISYQSIRAAFSNPIETLKE